MGKAAQHKEKKDQKRSIKDKKKFKNRNSIGKAKKRDTRYITRTQAVAKLQVALKDFRKLCILKGVYPREPKKKTKGGNTTYFFAKDIQFLQHEPLLATFREQKAFLKKIRRACGRHERLQAERLDARRPTYKLDHLIRERYPTFVDALRELDDALCLVFLFASLSPSKFVPASRVATCVRLRTEFLAYVARTNALRFTFISIKGIYYQAEIHGVLLTWIEPHHCFAQQPTMTVDYRVMLSFLELYDAMLTFVNFKLYHDLGLAYPPLMDSDARQAGQHISAVLLSKAAPSMAVEPTVQERARLGTAPSSASSDAAPSERQLSELRSKLSRLDDNPEHVHELHHDPATAKSSPEEAVIYESNPEAVALRILFSSCNLFCCRETPIPSLELLVLSCGGKIGWEGEASPFSATDPCVTHIISDRPHAGHVTDAATCTIVQPQWVFDCVNARMLLPAHAYRPGVICPAHLSPFCDGNEGYLPTERVRQAAAAGTCSVRRESNGKGDGMDEGGKGSEEDSDGEDNRSGQEGESEEELSMQYEAELSKEVTGHTTAKLRSSKALTQGSAPVEDEEKALAMLTMPHKKRRLYDRMQFGINRKAAAAAALRAKRTPRSPDGA
jgi:pescadillo protein